MTVDRRSLIAATLGLGAASGTLAAAENSHIVPNKPGALRDAFRQIAHDIAGQLEPGAERDQTAALQAAIDRAAEKDVPLVLPPGIFRVGDIRLRSGTRIIGQARTTVLQFMGGAAFITADKADNLLIADLVIDGAYKPFDVARGEGLVNVTRAKAITLDSIEVRSSAGHGIALVEASGRVADCDVAHCLATGIKSLDARGLNVTGNTVTDCGDNGIQIWRTESGEDGSIVSGNRITKIRNASGGTGEYGNGVNVFKAGGVLVSANRIADCAYSAVRGNAASNIQIIANSCERLGEVAIYSEFEFEGALIANNLVDHAASGIEVTNFKEGGRIAVIQGNLIRNLFRREREPVDKRGDGIGVEADATVTGNTIENAPSAGIRIGWGPYMRNVAATGNVVRNAGIGIALSSADDAGPCLVANNLIAGARDGAIRLNDHGTPRGGDLARDAEHAGRHVIQGNLAHA
ncbi:MAG: TIGR03808 family TAT-translocated repetitive protein [Hyphomicrobium sp.]